MLNRVIGRFWNDHRGYVIALTVIAMPLLLGFSLLVIDVGRSGNLHTDLQNAVDAMALTAARELDGRDDAIDRANAAVAKLTNTAAFGDDENGNREGLGSHSTIDLSMVTVVYLKEIPASDNDKIDPDGPMVTIDPALATYAWVISKQAMTPIFPKLVGFMRGPPPKRGWAESADKVSVSAEAVAVYRATACDVTPIYICNPYESPSGGNAEQASDLLHANFASGNLYGRQIELHNNNSATSVAGPGNFGFLETLGKGADVLREALATGRPGVCYKQDDLTTEPGAMKGPVEHGLNTRFGLYHGGVGSNDDPLYRPAPNVRMAQQQSGNTCKDYAPESDAWQAVPLGYGTTMDPIPGGGGRISHSNDWNLDLYWDISHSGKNPSPLKSNPGYVPPAAPAAAIRTFSSSFPGGTTPPDVQPSAYDVYNYELGHADLILDKAPNNETGIPQCHKKYSLADYPDSTYGNRREIFAAIINCVDQQLKGRTPGVEAIAFARMFLTKPVITSGSDSHMTLEMIDITGQGGRGTLDEFLREEAELVR